jgi:FAD synthetase
MRKVLVGGCFNKIHLGHIKFLKEAKKLGDYLVVVLAHDKNNKKPYKIPAKIRKENLERLKIADKVIVGHRNDFRKTIEKEMPNIIALGYDQKLPKDLEDYIKKLKIKIVRIKKFGNYRTRDIIYTFLFPILFLSLFLLLSFQ